jgi:ABC-type oligopeptide transport system substrate-binding subunit
MASDTSPIYRQMDELWQRCLSAVGIKVDFQVKMLSERNKAAQAGQLQMATFNWTDDTANDFVRLFYGPNAGAGNLARFRNAQFDAIPTGTAYIFRNAVAVL